MSWTALLGLLGIITGTITSWFAFEELKDGAKYLKFFRQATFGVFVALFLFHYGIEWMVIGLLGLGLAFKALSENSFSQFIPLAFAIAWIWPQTQLMAGLFFLTGFFQGGVWSAQQKLRTKKTRIQKLGITFLTHHWWYLLPLATSLIK